MSGTASLRRRVTAAVALVLLPAKGSPEQAWHRWSSATRHRRPHAPIALPAENVRGARLTWYRPFIIGQLARREAEIRNIEMKSGRTGTLAFVTVAYRYFQSESTGSSGQSPATETDLATCALCLEEEQDILSGARAVAASTASGRTSTLAGTGVVADGRPRYPIVVPFLGIDVQRPSNSFRPGVRDSEEGYPGLVVHGPLTALLLMQLLRANSTARWRHFISGARRHSTIYRHSDCRESRPMATLTYRPSGRMRRPQWSPLPNWPDESRTGVLGNAKVVLALLILRTLPALQVITPRQTALTPNFDRLFLSSGNRVARRSSKFTPAGNGETRHVTCSPPC